MIFTLRYMRLEDIPQVLEIDKLSFPLPWSARSYTFEISDNSSSHMITLEQSQEQPINPDPPLTIVGYGSFWLIDGEAHISTIAVHPTYRGKGFGEVLLVGMLDRSMLLRAEYAVLEVRVSNSSALSLYYKYEFEVVGRRRRYYRDNNEDAFQMHLAPLDEAYKSRFKEMVNRLNARVPFVNIASAVP